jgi:YhcH/YjgK/YiaL family protein
VIIGNINEKGAEFRCLHPVIKEALEYLKKTDLASMEKKKHPIKGDDLFLIIDEYKTMPASEKVAEQHRKYIDIHYMIKGKELIGLGFENKRNKFTEAYVPEKDRALFSSVVDESFIILKQGYYAVMFPSDIHRPGCCETCAESNVKKAVIKIAIDTLK